MTKAIYVYNLYVGNLKIIKNLQLLYLILFGINSTYDQCLVKY